MKTQIIDRTSGGSAEKFKIGMEGYFWDCNNEAVIKGFIEDMKDGLFQINPKSGWFRYFSPTIPEWFLPSEAKAEKKGIELVWCINMGFRITSAQRSLTEFILVERIAAKVYSHDLIRCEHEDGTVFWYFGEWNDGVI